jgi:hypothetical protein
VFGEIGQLFVAAKSPASVPEVVILEIVYATLSLLVRIAVSGVVVVPWACVRKSRLLGETLTGARLGTTPAPEVR